MEYAIGDFGKATFIAKKNWKFPITCYGRIIDMDEKCLIFVDNEENEFYILRSKFEFEKKEFKIKTP